MINLFRQGFQRAVEFVRSHDSEDSYSLVITGGLSTQVITPFSTKEEAEDERRQRRRGVIVRNTHPALLEQKEDPEQQFNGYGRPLGQLPTMKKVEADW